MPLSLEQVSDLATLVKKLAGELGIPNLRLSWRSLQREIEGLNVEKKEILEKVSAQIAPHESLLLVFALSFNDTDLRPILLRQALGNLKSHSSPDSLKVLFYFPVDELKIILEKLLKTGGKTTIFAVYLMARLSLYLNSQAILSLLISYKWEDDALHNLAFLVNPKRKPELQEELTSHKTENPNYLKVSQVFLKKLEQVEFSEPVAPESSPETEKNETVSSSIEEISTSQNREDNGFDTSDLMELVPAIPEIDSGKSTLKLSQKLLEKETKPDSPFRGSIENFKRKLFWGVISATAVLAIVPIYFLSVPVDSPASNSAVTTKAPEYWIDSVSRKKITQEFLQADNDFQMGELFLVRGNFESALTLFRDALARDPNHISAQFREGYCLFRLNDMVMARKAFEKAVTLDPKYPLVYLFLARIAIKNNDWVRAESEYEKEYQAELNWRVGLEFAEFLMKQNKKTKAKRLLTQLVQKHPGNFSISSTLARTHEETAKN